MPDLTGFRELGFKVKTSRGQLFVEKVGPQYKIGFSQGFEPDHPTLGEIVDFSIPDGFIVIHFLQGINDSHKSKLMSELDGLFRFHQFRSDYLFLYDTRLDFNTEQIGVKMEKVVRAMEKLF